MRGHLMPARNFLSFPRACSGLPRINLLKQKPLCRSFVRACLFQPGERQRLDTLVGSAAGDPARMSALQRAAPVELAVHAASSGSWDRCVPICLNFTLFIVHLQILGMTKDPLQHAGIARLAWRLVKSDATVAWAQCSDDITMTPLP